jgi:hypothetical protein
MFPFELGDPNAKSLPEVYENALWRGAFWPGIALCEADCASIGQSSILTEYDSENLGQVGQPVA